MYYDGEHHEQNRLQLNDLVEIVGMVSVDPRGAAMDNCNRYASEQDDFFNDFIDPLTLPPPSLLPRLHVLHYKKIDLDMMMLKFLKDIDLVHERNQEHEERSICIQAFSNFVFDGGQGCR